VFGLENSVDFFSSVIVLWRFYYPGETNKEREAMLEKREKRASIAISMVLFILGVAVIGTSTHALTSGGFDTGDLGFLITMSFLGTFVLGGMCVIKFQYAAKLDSASLYKDGVCSTIGCILSIFLFLNTLIIERTPSLWWLDPLVALFCGIASLLIGGHAIVVAKMQGLPIFTRSWWMLSQGDGHDEMDGRKLEQADFGEGVEMPSDPDGPDKTKLSEVV
jgi:divalent metal cation (Fe/Co/Zn/Cd) transporter